MKPMSMSEKETVKEKLVLKNPSLFFDIYNNNNHIKGKLKNYKGCHRNQATQKPSKLFHFLPANYK